MDGLGQDGRGTFYFDWLQRDCAALLYNCIIVKELTVHSHVLIFATLKLRLLVVFPRVIVGSFPHDSAVKRVALLGIFKGIRRLFIWPVFIIERYSLYRGLLVINVELVCEEKRILNLVGIILMTVIHNIVQIVYRDSLRGPLRPHFL